MSMLALYRPVWLLLTIPFAAAALFGVLLGRLLVPGDPDVGPAGGFRAFRMSGQMLVLATAAGAILGLVIGIAVAMKAHP